MLFIHPRVEVAKSIWERIQWCHPTMSSWIDSYVFLIIRALETILLYLNVMFLIWFCTLTRTHTYYANSSLKKYIILSSTKKPNPMTFALCNAPFTCLTLIGPWINMWGFRGNIAGPSKMSKSSELQQKTFEADGQSGTSVWSYCRVVAIHTMPSLVNLVSFST